MLGRPRRETDGRAQGTSSLIHPSARGYKQWLVPASLRYRRILLKLSGEALMADGKYGIHPPTLQRIAGEIRRAQAAGFCPGIDPVLTASALSAMLEHFCYIWLGQGGERVDAQFDDERAIDTLATIWVRSVYWLPESPA